MDEGKLLLFKMWYQPSGIGRRCCGPMVYEDEMMYGYNYGHYPLSICTFAKCIR